MDKRSLAVYTHRRFAPVFPTKPLPPHRPVLSPCRSFGIYYHKKDHEINMHIFENFDQACQIVAEVWVHEPNNAYTIVDEGDK